MAEPRRYLGETLTERLLARGERRLRVGVSSAFFARFGLANPWDLDDSHQGWGAFWFRFGDRRGLLGALWERFDGLGLDWAWPDRELAAMARIPGSGLGRPRSPWGPYARPRFSFLLPELEEIEAEEPAARRRFRRRPRRARRADPQQLPLVGAAVPAALPLPVAATPAGRRGLEPVPTPLPSAPRSFLAPPAPEGPPSRPATEALPPLRAPRPLARVLQRQLATVGGPSLRRALAQDAPATWSALPPVVPPALQGPMAWAETRLNQASSAPVGRPRPVTQPLQGSPPQAGRRLLPVLFRSPSLAFLAPQPEIESSADDQPSTPAGSPTARRRPARPRHAPLEAPPSAAPALEPRIARSAPASAQAAQRLLRVQRAEPEPAASPYRSLRRASAPAAQRAATPLLRAVERAPAPSAAPRRAEVGPTAAPRSLDQLLIRAERSPGLPGRLQTQELASADAPGPSRAQQRARLLTGERSARPFFLRSPMLAFIDAVEQEPGLETEPTAGFERAASSSRARSARADAVVSRRTRAATAASLRADPPRAGARSVLPHPIRRQEAPTAVSLSDAAFPGRGRLARLRREAPEQAPWVSGSRSLRVPWLPMDRLVRPEPAQAEPAPEVLDPRRARPAHQAAKASPPRRAEAPERPAVVPPARFQPPASPPPLRASARAAARFAEAWGPPARPVPSEIAELSAVPVPAAPRRRPETPTPRAGPAARAVAPAAVSAAPSPRRARVLPEPPLPVIAARPALALGPSAAPPSPRSAPSSTQRALQRLDPDPDAPTVVPAGPLAASPTGRQVWAFVRPPSTVWLQWRDLENDGAGPTPQRRGWAPVASPFPSVVAAPQPVPSAGSAASTPPRSWAPVSRSISAPMRLERAVEPARAFPSSRLFGAFASPMVLPLPATGDSAEVPSIPGSRPARARALPSSRALPSGRALGRLAARSRVQQRAAAVTGDIAPRGAPPRPPRAALVLSDAPERARTPREVAEAGAPRKTSRPTARGPEAERAVRIAAIDKLLGGGASAQALLPALARVQRPEEALRIVLERSLGWRGRGLPAPVRQLVDQVQAASEQPAEGSPRRRPSLREPRREALRRQPPRPQRRAAAVPASQADATVHHVQANYRIVGLVKKLEALIHLVDVEHRLAAARSQVRMAEDSPGAQPSVSADDSSDAQAQLAGQDVDALVQHIVEFVSEEMALLSMRRPEAPAEHNPWF